MPVRPFRFASFSALCSALCAIAACRAGDVPQGARAPAASAPSAASAASIAPAARGEDASVALVETPPAETWLDHADVANAADVWPAMIDAARRSIDFAEFYASDADEQHLATSKLTPVIVAIERATARGVRVRFMADQSFVKTYPDTLERLRKANVDVKTVDYAKLAGGIIHAKYFVVDDADVFIGSQNFDWRALEHIQEMGVRIHSPSIAHALEDVFAIDWSGERRPGAAPKPVVTRGGETLTFVATPKGWLPDESEWALPHLVSAIDGAKRAIDVQVLAYGAHHRDGSEFTTLEDALRRAAARGVKVRLLVSHWAKPKSLAAIAAVPNVEVRVITIPPWSGGEIPFARVAHAKYAVFDGSALAWVGTSNWEGDYFTKTRNVGVMIEGGELPARLHRIFEDGWLSPYSTALASESPPSSSDPARP